jgi:arsenate reductase (thioredoxin)
MLTILVLCTGNSCRSQIAEGYLRHFAGNKARIFSAGIEAHGLNPWAVRTMAEDGLDISGHTSNHIDEFRHLNVDLLLTVCDHAQENCPYFPSQAKRLHCNFPDPAKATGSPDEIANEFRKVRDLIKAYCAELVEQHVNT